MIHEKTRDRSVIRYSVAPAGAEHLSALSGIELSAAQMLKGHVPESVLTETTPIETFQRAADAGRLWIALASGAPVGFAIVEMLAEDLPHLDELDVNPDHSRRGLGTALVRAVCQWARANKFPLLTLTTFRDVPWNMPFYAHLGFVELPPARLRPELRQVVAAEAARGLNPDNRVVMGYWSDQPEP